MLQAILLGKAGRIETDNGDVQSWREVFKLREDLLTAVFFSRIRYLSEDGERKILSLLVGNNAASQLGAVNEYIFWPKLSGLEGRSFVEPDILIVCENALILIEVKPPFGGNQRSDQWRNEIESLLLQDGIADTESGELPNTIHFVALGNNTMRLKLEASALQNEYVEHGLQVHVREWEKINHAIMELHNAEEGRDSSVYSDWIEAFSLFGLVDRSLQFSDMLRMPAKIDNQYQSICATWVIPVDDTSENTLQLQQNQSRWYDVYQLTIQQELRINLWKSP